MDSRVALVVLVVASFGSVAVAQLDIGSLMKGVHPDCVGLVTNLATGCGQELAAASAAMGIPFPPTDASQVQVDPVQVENYVNSSPPVSQQCCKASCEIAKRGCGCDRGSFDALMAGISGHADVVVKVFQKVAETCTNMGVPFVVTLKSIAGACDADPNITCPA